jgi:hypothetical protein
MGKFTQADLAVYGLKAKDLASFELVDSTCQVRLYTSTNCTGSSILRRTSAKLLSTAYTDKVCSIVVEPNPTAIKEINSDTPKNKNHEAIYNLNGQRLNKIHKGINIVDGKKIMVK